MLEFTYYGGAEDDGQKVTVTAKLETTHKINEDRLERVHDPKIQDNITNLAELILDANWDCV